MSFLWKILYMHFQQKISKIHSAQLERILPEVNELIPYKSFFEISADRRKLINALIQKFAGSKTSGL